MTAPRFRVGSVPYANALPLVWGLAEDGEIEFRTAPPSRLARELDAGALDAALVSSIHARRRGLDFLDGVAIASEGPVRSVLLVGREDPRKARTVALDGASLTASALARLLYLDLFGRPDVRFEAAPPAPDPDATGADATLVIGDPALALLGGARRTADLGELWTRLTGLPFVWAVWALSPCLDADAARRLGERLRRAREQGLDRLRECAAAASARLGLPESTMRDYLCHAIRYELDRRALAGLDRFVERAGFLGALPPEAAGGDGTRDA